MKDLEAVTAYRYALVEAQAVSEQLDALGDLNQQELLHYKAELSARVDELRQVGEQFEGVLKRVRDPRTRMVVRQYYGLGKSDEQVALATGLSTRTVNSIRNRFLHDWAIIEAAHAKK